MYLRENPVLQHELIANLRLGKSFLLLLVYVALLGGVVYLAWPQDTMLDLTGNPEASRRLVNMFFLGQFVLASMMTPSFAAAAITGEKERKSYEMLLASPLQPGAIVLGKLVASLTHIAILILCSLPIVMLCLPLGGVSPFEVLAAFIAMLSSVVLFGMISVACSSYFRRTSASLVVAYILILPLVLFGALLWRGLEQYGDMRFWITVVGAPLISFLVSFLLWKKTSHRLLHPADLGSEGKEVVDLETEAQDAVGLYIKRDEFPDKLFAPPKRNDFIADGTNPIYDKEMRSEIFSQGTLMLRLVIQVSMGLAIPVMAVCLFISPKLAPWYIGYVVLFNVLVGPVFSAGSITNERERQTLDLLLTTLITPWQMLWGKLIAGLRVSTVLTSFLLWPLILACVMPVGFWRSLDTMLFYLLIVAICSVLTAVIAMFCSVFFQKTSMSLMTSYLVIVTQFVLPPAANYFADTFFPNTNTSDAIHAVSIISPITAAFSLPLDAGRGSDGLNSSIGATSSATTSNQNIYGFLAFMAFAAFEITLLLLIMVWLFNGRWRVSG